MSGTSPFHRMIIRAAILGCASLTLSSCGVFVGSDCHDVAGYALRVTVTDSLTGQPPTSVPSLTVTDGAFSEVHPTPDLGGGNTNEFLAARERPGVYEIVVRAAGYVDWTRSAITVGRGGDCAVIQTALVGARLRRP